MCILKKKIFKVLILIYSCLFPICCAWNQLQLGSFENNYESQNQELLSHHKELLLHEHNGYRTINHLKDSNFSKMLSMTWSEEIAQEAQARASKCVLNDATDGDKKTKSNVYLNQGELFISALIEKAVRKWDSEKIFYKSQECIGVCDYSILNVWSELYAMGCGLSKCTNIRVEGRLWKVGQILVCNYGLPSYRSASNFIFLVE